MLPKVQYEEMSHQKFNLIRNRFVYLKAFGERASSNYELCLYLTSFRVFTYAASLTSLTAVSIDRFWAICYPINYRNNSSRIDKTIIVAFWVFAFFIGVFPLMDKRNEERFAGKCINLTALNKNYLTYLGLQTVTSCLIMVIMYSCIYVKIAKQVSNLNV